MYLYWPNGLSENINNAVHPVAILGQRERSSVDSVRKRQRGIDSFHAGDTIFCEFINILGNG